MNVFIATYGLPAFCQYAARVESVDVVGHYDMGIGTTDAASAGYITPQLIDDRPLLRPGEVLEYIPGMIVTQHSGAGKANQYFLRGFNLDHGTDFQTTVAGMPVNMRTNAHGQGYTDLNFLIPELVSGIDYFKGPYYAQQGDFATAGSANIFYAETLPNNLAEFEAALRNSTAPSKIHSRLRSSEAPPSISSITAHAHSGSADGASCAPSFRCTTA